MSSLYDVGDLITVSTTFTVAGVPTDPATIVCRIKAPDSTVSTKTYGIDSELVKETTGAYHLDVSATQHGTYRYRWEGTGAAQGAEEGTFVVRRSGVLA